jgi:hypothetical protein
MKLHVLLVASLMTGCAANMTLVKPVDPNHIAVQSNPNAQFDAVVQVDDFSLGNIKTNFSDRDMQQFRSDMPVTIGNKIFSMLAGGGLFRSVKRTLSGPEADFIVSGTYDFYSYLGTHGREWIPLAGTVGARINEATIRETIHVSVLETKTGRVILDRAFHEDQEEWTSIYQTAQAAWLQPNFVGRVSQGIGDAIRAVLSGSAELTNSEIAKPDTEMDAGRESREGSAEQQPVVIPNPVIESINGRVGHVQFFVDQEIDPARVPDFMHKCGTAKPQKTFAKATTEFVWFCVFVVPQGRFSTGSASFTMALRRTSDGSLVTWLPGATLELRSTDPYGMLLQGYGATEAGRIEVGGYRLEVYSSNEFVGGGTFEVR